MGVSAVAEHMPAMVIDLDRVLDRLPASARAQVMWTRPVLRDAFAKLRDEPLSDDLVNAVACTFVKPMAAVGLAVSECLSSNELGAIVQDSMSVMRSDLAGSEGADAETLDTVEWCLEILRGVARTFATLGGSLPSTPPSPEDMDSVADGPVRGLVVGQMLLMAAASAARGRKESPPAVSHERIGELVDRAFLALTRFVDSLRREGIVIEPFADDTTQLRAARVIRAADGVREALHDVPDGLGSARFLSMR